MPAGAWDWVGRAGQAMLLLGVAVMLGCLLAGLVRALPVVRRAQALRRTLALQQDQLRALTAELAALQAENRRLRRPLERARRWLRHPLVGALWTSYRMRRRRGGAAR